MTSLSSEPRFWSARLRWVLLTSVAFVACAFPDHRFSDENCFNGIDDDGNGLIDCDDPGCQPVTQCVDAAPTADGWSGPITIWQGTDSKTAPLCASSHYPHTLFDTLSSNPEKGAATCPECTCNATASSNQPQCFARLQVSSNPQCGGGTNEFMTGADGLAGFPIGQTCTTINIDLSKFAPKSIFLTQPYVVDDSCAPTETGTPVIDPPTFGTSLEACDLQGVQAPGGCGSQKTCAPKPNAGFSPYVCIYKQTDATTTNCPSTYYNTKFVFSEYTDGRHCSQCTCAPANENCTINGPVPGLYYDDQFCGAGGNYLQLTPNCMAYPTSSSGTPAANIYAKLTYTSVNGAGGSCVATAGTIQGDVSALHSYTFCCTPIQ